jgi:hypothetical protein
MKKKKSLTVRFSETTIDNAPKVIEADMKVFDTLIYEGDIISFSNYSKFCVERSDESDEKYLVFDTVSDDTGRSKKLIVAGPLEKLVSLLANPKLPGKYLTRVGKFLLD